jgi:predicted patatin/cPLA2 family phospholipase
MGKLVLLLLVLLVVLSYGQVNSGKKCRALVLQGGGDMGAYQVGVLKAFVDNLPVEETMWDVVTGVSVGSINAAALSLHDIGQEHDAIDWMVNLWESFGASDIYKNWRFGMLEGLFFEEGLWDNSPEYAYLKGQFDQFDNKTLKRRVNINTVDFDTGEVYRYNETMDWEKVPEAVTASSSMPFAFPHTYMDGHVFVDGGSVWNFDLAGAIERCKEITTNEKDIIVDIVMCNSVHNITEKDNKNYNTIHNYARYQEIRSWYGQLSDYCEIKRGFPDVQFRYVVAPQQDLPSGFLPLGFKHDSMVEMLNIGIEEGTQAVKDKTNVYDKILKNSSDQFLCPDSDFD